ncbi:hypothetical protein CASFOL_036989 [Castilleja foliolosa]|uniref:F-box domain-containing protein n=1 Tax=Castilleja foliolosa TaxID=1961234 RepID=A0ABD3BQN4_9LAMI
MGSDDQKLCSDVILEILTLKTLDTCKCVSKKWNNLIYESNFKSTYRNRTNNLVGYFIQSSKQWTNCIPVFVEMLEKDKVMELWLKGNDGWTLEMAVSLSSLIGRNLHPIDFYDADIVFIESDWEVVFYKLEDRGVIRKVELGRDFEDGRNKHFEFRSDWEPVDLRGVVVRTVN